MNFTFGKRSRSVYIQGEWITTVCLCVSELAHRWQRQNEKHRRLHNLVTESVWLSQQTSSLSQTHTPTTQIRLSLYIQCIFNIYSSCVSEHCVDTRGNILDLFCTPDISSIADITGIHMAVAHRALFTQSQQPKAVIHCHWLLGQWMLKLFG